MRSETQPAARFSCPVCTEPSSKHASNPAGGTCSTQAHQHASAPIQHEPAKEARCRYRTWPFLGEFNRRALFVQNAVIGPPPAIDSILVPAVFLLLELSWQQPRRLVICAFAITGRLIISHTLESRTRLGSQPLVNPRPQWMVPFVALFGGATPSGINSQKNRGPFTVHAIETQATADISWEPCAFQPL